MISRRATPRLTLACGLLLFGLCLGAPLFAQTGEDCETPMHLTDLNIVDTLDTRTFADNLNRELDCLSVVPDGPDVVFVMIGYPCFDIAWHADFDAVIYVLFEDCLVSPCLAGSAGQDGSFFYNAGYSYPPEFNSYFLVIDGSDGASGTVILTMTGGYNVPVVGETWGRIKDTYREQQNR
jgi:hypothetical protein